MSKIQAEGIEALEAHLRQWKEHLQHIIQRQRNRYFEWDNDYTQVEVEAKLDVVAELLETWFKED